MAKLFVLSALAALVLLLAAAAPAHAAGADMATCAKLVDSMGGGAGLTSMAPSCNTAGGSFSIPNCCSQIKALISASGPTGAACFCDPTVFSTFSAQVNIPGFSNSAIPFFLGNMCRIPIPGKGC
jgi:hypothetical protein